MNTYGNKVYVSLAMSCPDCGSTVFMVGDEHMHDPEPFDGHSIGDFLFSCKECGKEFKLTLRESAG